MSLCLSWKLVWYWKQRLVHANTLSITNQGATTLHYPATFLNRGPTPPIYKNESFIYPVRSNEYFSRCRFTDYTHCGITVVGSYYSACSSQALLGSLQGTCMLVTKAWICHLINAVRRCKLSCVGTYLAENGRLPFTRIYTANRPLTP